MCGLRVSTMLYELSIPNGVLEPPQKLISIKLRGDVKYENRNHVRTRLICCVDDKVLGGKINFEII